MTIRMQTVRRRRWWQALHLDKMPAVLPKVPKKFLRSPHWDSQLIVMRADFRRITGLNHVDVVELTSRFAANVGACGYLQGYLYLIRTLSWVLGRRQDVLYWSFVRVAHITRPYGPLGTEMQLRNETLDAALKQADPDLDQAILASMVSVRWGFIMFSQTFVDREQLLCVWDFILPDESRMGCVMGALLKRIRFPDEPDTLLRLSKTMDIVIEDGALTAEILAIACTLL